MGLFTKDNMDADKTIPVVNIPTLKFICVLTSQGRIGSIQGAWDP